MYFLFKAGDNPASDMLVYQGVFTSSVYSWIFASQIFHPWVRPGFVWKIGGVGGCHLTSSVDPPETTLVRNFEPKFLRTVRFWGSQGAVNWTVQFIKQLNYILQLNERWEKIAELNDPWKQGVFNKLLVAKSDGYFSMTGWVFCQNLPHSPVLFHPNKTCVMLDVLFYIDEETIGFFSKPKKYLPQRVCGLRGSNRSRFRLRVIQ